MSYLSRGWTGSRNRRARHHLRRQPLRRWRWRRHAHDARTRVVGARGRIAALTHTYTHSRSLSLSLSLSLSPVASASNLGTTRPRANTNASSLALARLPRLIAPAGRGIPAEGGHSGRRGRVDQHAFSTVESRQRFSSRGGSQTEIAENALFSENAISFCEKTFFP